MASRFCFVCVLRVMESPSCSLRRIWTEFPAVGTKNEKKKEKGRKILSFS
jgi:hypothetical protein